jgi:DNA-binding PadR family transcriptional regulator
MTRQALNPTAASLLGFLHHGPLTGWDLVTKAQTTIGDFWNVTKSQVYRELKLLADQGLVREGVSGARDRQPYSITKEGRSAFSEWIGREPAERTMRFPLALTVYFGRHVEPALLRAFCLAHRRRHAEQLEVLLGLVPVLEAANAEYEREVLRLGIGFHQLVIRWMDGLPWMKDDAPRASDAARGGRKPRPRSSRMKSRR